MHYFAQLPFGKLVGGDKRTLYRRYVFGVHRGAGGSETSALLRVHDFTDVLLEQADQLEYKSVFVDKECE
ncbi:MAG: hypothetical protein ACE5HC_09610 [Candidatus Binatia bacterium]